MSVFSAPYSFTPQCSPATYLYGYNISSTSIYISWSSNSNAKYNLTYRPAGTTTVTAVNGLTSSVLALTGLTNSTVYEVSVQVICADGSLSAFSVQYSFTTACNTPTYPYLNSLGSNSAQLGWSNFGPDTRYDLVYRVVGAPVSTTVSSLTTSFYNLTGLVSSTAYEWQVRTVCSDGNTSPFSTPYSFTTTGCLLPNYLYESYVTSSEAQVTWYGSAGLRYLVQWRLTSSTGTTWPMSATVLSDASGYVVTKLTRPNQRRGV